MTAPNPPTTFAKMASRSLPGPPGGPRWPFSASTKRRRTSPARRATPPGRPLRYDLAGAFLGQLNQFDFDIGGTLLATLDDTRGIVDLGDLPTDAADTEGNCGRITQAIGAILQAEQCGRAGR